MRLFLLSLVLVLLAGCGKREHWTEQEMQSHLAQDQAWQDARLVAMNGKGRNVGFITDTSNSMGEYRLFRHHHQPALLRCLVF